MWCSQKDKTRMHAALNSAVGGRNNLWQQANLVATGTDGSPIQTCAPNTDFEADNITVCAGATVNFMISAGMETLHGHGLSWWNTSSTDSFWPLHTIIAGTYDVTLQQLTLPDPIPYTRTSYIEFLASKWYHSFLWKFEVAGTFRERMVS